MKRTKKQEWLAIFEQIVTDKLPEETGYINWDSAIYLYNTGETVSDAAYKYCKSRI